MSSLPSIGCFPAVLRRIADNKISSLFRLVTVLVLGASHQLPSARAADFLVFVSGNASTAEDKLFKADSDGSNLAVLTSGSSLTAVPSRMAVDRANRRIYVCDQTNGGGGLFRYDADGSNKTTIYANSVSGSQTLGVAVDSTHALVYFLTGNASATEDKLFRCDLSGGSLTTLVSGSSFTAIPNTLAVDEVNQRLYVADQTTGGGGVFRFDSSGGSKTTIYANSVSGSQILGLAVDSVHGLVYFVSGNASSAEDKLFRCDLSGASLTTLTSGASLTAVPNQITVDPTQNTIYVCDQTTAGGGIFRFDSSGGSKTTIYANSVSGSQILGTAYMFTTGTTIASLNRVNATPSNAATVNWTATFGAAVTGVTAANFSLSGAAATGASIGTPTTGDGGTTWNVPVTTGSTSGTLQLSLANSTGMSQSISTTLPFAGQSYTMDTTGPTVTSIVRQTPSGQTLTTGTTTATFRVTFSEPVNTPAAANFAVTAVNSSSIVGSISSVTAVSTSIYDVAVSLSSGTGEFRLKVTD